MLTQVVYGTASEAWGDYHTLVESACSGRDVRRVCDLGGGANPYLRSDEVEQLDIEYNVLDIDADELAKAPDDYQTIVGDVMSTGLAERYSNNFDVVFSKLFAEHVEDARLFHANVLTMLRPGGLAIHFMPTLYAIPFLINLYAPATISAKILALAQPGRHSSGNHGKFPAHYKMCRGPTARQLSALRAIGYEILEARGYFGHQYFRRVKLAQALEDHLSRHFVRHQHPLLTSYAIYVLRRPCTTE